MKIKFAVVLIIFGVLCLGGYWKMMHPAFLQRDEWRNLREDPIKNSTFQKVVFPPGAKQNTFWLENRNTPDGVKITSKHRIDVDYQFEFHFAHGFAVQDFVNLGGDFTKSFHKPVEVSMTSYLVPMGKRFYPYVQLQWERRYYLVDHYVGNMQDKNPVRLNANGETDATHDGSWEGWADVYTGGHSQGLSGLYNSKDFDDSSSVVIRY